MPWAKQRELRRETSKKFNTQERQTMMVGDDDNMENLCNIIYASFARILERENKKNCV